MLPNVEARTVNGEEPQADQGKQPVEEIPAAPVNAGEFAQKLSWLPKIRSSHVLADRWLAAADRLKPVLRRLQASSRRGASCSTEAAWLHDNVNFLSMELQGTCEGLRPLRKLPHVQTPSGEVVPRILALAEEVLQVHGYRFSEPELTAYLKSFQEWTVLDMAELWGLVAAMKLVLLEQIAEYASLRMQDAQAASDGEVCVRSLREIAQAPWQDVIEPLILFDRILRDDPSGAYSRMEFESRDVYRKEVARIARHSDLSEQEVALAALALARQGSQRAYADPRQNMRRSHIGFYLVGEGAVELHREAGYRPSFGCRVQAILRKHPDEFYLLAIEVLTAVLVSGIVMILTAPYSSLALIPVIMLVLLLPCSQSAVQVVNYLMTALLKPQILPKLDLMQGIPEDCAALVAVPALLLNENQVRRLVDDLEVRFLGNRDRNLHFALLTDMPDSPAPPREENPLVVLCSGLIRGLNEKYADEASSSFFLLHRHRIYNPREHAWMGWERKRGKLLDLNHLLRGKYDSFPVKIGDLSILPKIRFVITLDADTELPRGSAHRMIGTLAHPLNQAILDRENNIVVAGYGILQPRVGVSVQSAARSRLAKFYSGQTGFDIYTRTVSDVYQDLYGEGSFAGKGIYEVDIVQAVLDGRFPRNALLSHDLIEGAYARAGLVSDIEIIEDYPSHYSAYNRRKHRWLRGDWQVAEWLGPTVTGESGRRERNPISLISQWKILDNLRRALVEPATFLLLVLGWLCLPGSPRAWTLATIAILFVPAWCRFLFELIHALNTRQKLAKARAALSGLLTAHLNILLMLTFLAHQMLISIDAMVRALVRRLVTRRNLLEWVTAAEAELDADHENRTPTDTYLDWTPVVAFGVGLLIFFVRRNALLAALPFLILWASSKLVSVWLNRPPSDPRNQPTREDRAFLRGIALRTWRYFAEFSNEEHNWLIPDNVQQDDVQQDNIRQQEATLRIAARVSPTNLGFLLNARQVACRFGYLTVPELAQQTQRTLATMRDLRHYRGHLLNWYDTRTLEPLNPAFVSSVDSGNLVASLWSLEQGCREQLRLPLLRPALRDGLLDHVRLLAEQRTCPRSFLTTLKRGLSAPNWLAFVLELPDTTWSTDPSRRKFKSQRGLDWMLSQTQVRFQRIAEIVQLYAPWLLPEFRPLQDLTAHTEWKWDRVPLQRIPEFIDDLTTRLQSRFGQENPPSASARLLPLLSAARSRATQLIQELQSIARDAAKMADAMDFRFLFNQHRKLLSIGFEVEKQELRPECYDLLASEARTATFIAIAKDHIPQESWFRLGRAHTLDRGRPVLLSWTGTMFEYLMPSIWMGTYPDTLLGRSQSAAVRAQQAYALARRIPWGISESAYSKKDDAGNYQYFAFGLPRLAVHEGEMSPLVISPYSTFLALHVDARQALSNLRHMNRLGWLRDFGFYEAADFTALKRRLFGRRYELVRCWMAHHQGMSLLSMANLLHGNILQHWFHRNLRVQATELLLQEKPVAHLRPALEKYGTAA